MGNNCCCGERQHETLFSDPSGRRRKPLTRAEKVAVLKQAFSRKDKSEGGAAPVRRRAPSFLQGPESPQSQPAMENGAPPSRRRDARPRRSLSEEPEWRLYDEASSSSQAAHSIGRSKSPLFKSAARKVVAANRWGSPAQARFPRGDSNMRTPRETSATMTPPSGRSAASTPTRMKSQRKNEALEELLKALAKDPSSASSRARPAMMAAVAAAAFRGASPAASAALPPQDSHVQQRAELQRLEQESGELAKLQHDLQAEVVRQTGLAGSGEAPTDWNGLPMDADPELRRLWQKYDLDRKGHLTPQQLQLLLQEQADATERQRLALDKRQAEALREQLEREHQRVEDLARMAEARPAERSATAMDVTESLMQAPASSAGVAPSQTSESRHAGISFLPREEQALMHGEFTGSRQLGAGKTGGLAVGGAQLEHRSGTLNFLTAPAEDEHRRKKNRKHHSHHRDARE